MRNTSVFATGVFFDEINAWLKAFLKTSMSQLLKNEYKIVYFERTCDIML